MEEERKLQAERDALQRNADMEKKKIMDREVCMIQYFSQ